MIFNPKYYLPKIPADREALGWVLLPAFIAVILLALDQYGLQTAYYAIYKDFPLITPASRAELPFYAQIYFSTSVLTLFVLLPILYHVAFPEKMENPFGLHFRSAIPHLPIYAFLLLFMLPAVWVISKDPGFYQFYPMYKPTAIQGWLIYEVIYMAQFFGVEFFFRGFALFRLEKRFGYYAVALMVIPYALIHIHKPFPEAVASIVAGYVLGYLALKSRSIWPGLMVHCGVALSMDIFSLIHSGRWAAMTS